MKKIFFALCILAAGCSSTSTINSWKAPGATLTPEQYKKVLVVVLAKDEQARKIAEEKVASNYKAINISYPIFTLKQLGEDTLKSKNMIKELGYDAMIVMRLVTVKAKSTYVAGSHNQAYQKNGIYYFGDYLNSSSYATDMQFIVATNVWSLKDEKLLWSGVTESTDPKKLDQLVDNVAEEVVYQMEQDKFITGK